MPPALWDSPSSVECPWHPFDPQEVHTWEGPCAPVLAQSPHPSGGLPWPLSQPHMLSPFVDPSVRITSLTRRITATFQLETMLEPQHGIVLKADYTSRAVCLAWYYYINRTFLSPGKRKLCYLLTKKPNANLLPVGTFSTTLLLFLESTNSYGFSWQKSQGLQWGERGELHQWSRFLFSNLAVSKP